MTSLVHRTSMFLLLLVCGPALYQASSCPMLDIVSLVSGTFYTVHSDGVVVNMTIQPFDNPALNQYYPLYHVEHWDDELYITGILLFAEGSSTSYTMYYYFFDKMSPYGTLKDFLSTMTLNDLPAKPNCTENGVLIGDKIEGFVSCFMINIFAFADYEHTCDYWLLRTEFLDLTPTQVDEETDFLTLPDYNYRTRGYPFPASWLEGHEDYEYLCPAS